MSWSVFWAQLFILKTLELWEQAYRDAKKAVKKAPTGGTGDGTVKNMASDYSSADVSWLLRDGVINKNQMAHFYETVANIQKLGYACPKSKSGLYMVDLGNVIAFTDADFENPIIYSAIEFFTQYENNLAEYKGLIYDEEGNTAGHRNAFETIENMQGEGYVSEHTGRNYTAYEGKNRSGERTAGRTATEESTVRGDTDTVKGKQSVSGTEDILEKGLRKRLQETVDQYDTLPAGETPARDATVPKRTSKTKRVSMAVRTALEAGVTPNMMVPAITKEVLDETFSYERKSNKDLQASAKEWMGNFQNVDLAVAEFEGEVSGKEYIEEDATVKGYYLYNELCRAAQQAKTKEEQTLRIEQAIQVLTDVTNVTRTNARMLQATGFCRCTTNKSHPKGWLCNIPEGTRLHLRKAQI